MSGSTPVSQEEYFRTVGGDAYFERNAAMQDEPRHHSAFGLLADLDGRLPEIRRAAVIGGAAGREAAALAELIPGCKVTNVDISPRAIEHGRAVFPHLEHRCASISAPGGEFADAVGEQDLVFLVGVLIWIDRRGLARAVANVDEVLRDGGLLLIEDFLPPTARRNPIRHAPEHFSYKQDYSAPFLALGTYDPVRLNTYVAAEPSGIPEAERTVAITLLAKNLYGRLPIGYAG